jgi:hypothetical protein
MRIWVSIKSLITGCGRYPFEIHDRKLEATILECKDNKVTYAYKTDMNEHLGDSIGTVPMEVFIKAYEPMQESIKFVCYRRGKDWDIDHVEPSDLEKREILNKVTKARILG